MNESQAISRPYHSPVRAQRSAETRLRIVEAARSLFAEQGYAVTTIAEVAAAADVSTQTIYNSVGGKADLLRALMDVADASANIPELRAEMEIAVSAREALALAARLRRLLMEQAADIIEVIQAAALNDPEVAEAWRDGQARSRAGMNFLAARLRALGDVRRDLEGDRLADVLFALLHPAVWLRLVGECGWSADGFETWCADVLARAVLVGEP